MKYNYLIVATILFFALTTMSQENNKNLEYKRYEGSIGEHINITANIVQLFNKLNGNYQYRFLEENGEMHFGRTVELNGEISDGDSASLKEFGKKDYTFVGEMNGEKYEGLWNATDNKKVAFEMKEYYPNGSMDFDVHYLRSEGKLNQSAGSPVAEIELTLLYPKQKYFEPRIIDSVESILNHGFFGPDFEMSSPDSMLSNFEKEYLDNYVKQNKNWHESGTSFNWEKTLSMAIIYNSSYMLCVEYLRYAYSGGSHGMTNIAYDIIHLDEGKLLTYADVFVEGSDSALSVLLTNQLRRDYQIPSEVSLKDAGFFVEEVKPNRNIYVDGNGVGFLFNSYEIAPYSQGATNIYLEFQKIADLVKMGTPVYQMSRRKTDQY